MLELQSRGRGRFYTPLRGVTESALRVLYRGGWPARAWGRLPGRCDVRVRHARLRALANGARPVRLGFASDLHLGPTTPEPLLVAAFEALRAAKPDVLLLGGDYVFLDATDDKARLLASLVARVDASYKYFALGNHDLWTHHGIIERRLERAGVVHLENRSASPLDSIAIVGIDDPWTGSPNAKAALSEAPPNRFPIFLCHSPDGLPEAITALDDRDLDPIPHPPSPDPPPRALFLCGHTHGGHVSTPFGPIVVPGRIGKLHPQGFARVRGVELCVSRGVGGIEIPVRAWARPEVVIVDLT